MHANAIMFAQPVLKFYLKLPLSQDEMSEILGFVFTGLAALTQESFDRTPMLVRTDEVAAALNWLKLNHEGCQTWKYQKRTSCRTSMRLSLTTEKLTSELHDSFQRWREAWTTAIERTEPRGFVCIDIGSNPSP
jgi:hypothetical protein